MIKFYIDQPSPQLRGYCGLMLDNLEKRCAQVLRTSDFIAIKLMVKISIEISELSADTNYCVISSHKPEIEGSIAIYRLISDIVKSELSSDFCEKHPQLHFKFIVRYQAAQSNSTTEIASFTPCSPKYTFDQLILPPKAKSEIMEALCIIEQTDLIYNKWGYGNVDPQPRSVLNFYGPPGTGKTMCAHAIAHKLNCPFLILNYADIESKYVGDAAKNMAAAFDTAEKYGAIMFFDEADSFLGKRIENVTQGSDQALNSLRSQTLMLLEEFSGVVIFATNLVKNFDHAFESRILKHIKFDLPTKKARASIIKGAIPLQLPIDVPFSDHEYLILGGISNGLSGREIKNAVLETLTKKAAKSGSDSIFCLKDFINSFNNKKQSINDLKKEKEASAKDKIIKALSKTAEKKKEDGTI